MLTCSNTVVVSSSYLYSLEYLQFDTTPGPAILLDPAPFMLEHHRMEHRGKALPDPEVGVERRQAPPLRAL